MSRRRSGRGYSPKRANRSRSQQTTYNYDDAGRIESTNLPNGVVTDYGYDDANRLTDVTNTGPGPTTISDFHYELDADGNRTSMTDLSGTQEYVYDSLYRLTEVTYPDPETDAYTYDDNGNRLSLDSTSYTYDAANQMLTAGGVSYGYDDNGNQTSRASDTFDYDHENRLIEAVTGSTTSTSEYNGDGLRMSLTVDRGSPVTTNYAWDVNRSLPVVLDDGSNEYVYGLDLISATNGSGDQTYFTGDGHGSTTDLTDDIGAATDSYSYDAFGAVRAHSGSSTTGYLYTGEQTDADTELQYLRARYYDPATGRFLSSDPLPGTAGSPQTQNPYAYAFDNPVNYEDPTGQYSILSFLMDLRPAFTCALAPSFTNFECIGDYLDAIVQYNEFVLDLLGRFKTLNCLSLLVSSAALVAEAAAPELTAASVGTYVLLMYANRAGFILTARNNALTLAHSKEGSAQVLAGAGTATSLAAVTVGTATMLDGPLGPGTPFATLAVGISAVQCYNDVVGS